MGWRLCAAIEIGGGRCWRCVLLMNALWGCRAECGVAAARRHLDWWWDMLAPYVIGECAFGVVS